MLLVAFQVMLGGLMSGMKAGFSYPTFPRMNGEWIPSILMSASEWTLDNMKNYDSGNNFATGLIQFVHRLTAYSIGILAIVLFRNVFTRNLSDIFKKAVGLFLMLVTIQIILGVYTLLGCKYGQVPLALGVLHQAVGLLTLSGAVYIWFLNRRMIV